VESAKLTASYQCVLHFFHTICLKYCAYHEKVRPEVIRSAAPVTQNHLSKAEDLILQNATSRRKSAPRPPNISGKDISCTAPATRSACLQTPCKRLMPHCFWTATKPSRFGSFCSVLLTFDKVQNPLRLPQKTTIQRPKVVRTFGVFPFSLWNMLWATAASTFSTSQRPKVVRDRQYMSVLCLIVFNTFDCETHFTPQQRALFRQLNFPIDPVRQKRGESWFYRNR